VGKIRGLSSALQHITDLEKNYTDED